MSETKQKRKSGWRLEDSGWVWYDPVTNQPANYLLTPLARTALGQGLQITAKGIMERAPTWWSKINEINEEKREINQALLNKGLATIAGLGDRLVWAETDENNLEDGPLTLRQTNVRRNREALKRLSESNFNSGQTSAQDYFLSPGPDKEEVE